MLAKGGENKGIIREQRWKQKENTKVGGAKVVQMLLKGWDAQETHSRRKEQKGMGDKQKCLWHDYHFLWALHVLSAYTWEKEGLDLTPILSIWPPVNWGSGKWMRQGACLAVSQGHLIPVFSELLFFLLLLTSSPVPTLKMKLTSIEESTYISQSSKNSHNPHCYKYFRNSLTFDKTYLDVVCLINYDVVLWTESQKKIVILK